MGSSGHSIFEQVISLENLFSAWREFKREKLKKQEVQEFEFHLEDNIFQLREDIRARTYNHGPYDSFCVRDPKLRHIHKASVRDRLLHQALFRVLYPIFDRKFIFDSYSCRTGKGTHRGVRRLDEFSRKASANYRKPAYALKCDVKKFFHSIDHRILLKLVQRTISEAEVLWLIDRIVESFHSLLEKGLPLGNVTSQLFANIYLNELDQFVKHTLKERYYIRYCDDFVILGNSVRRLEELVPQIETFLVNKLRLSLHPEKVIICKLSYGIDFLGYVVLPHYTVLRTKTKRRMFRKIRGKRNLLAAGKIDVEVFSRSVNSYLGLLKHCRGYKLRRDVSALNDPQGAPRVL